VRKRARKQYKKNVKVVSLTLREIFVSSLVMLGFLLPMFVAAILVISILSRSADGAAIGAGILGLVLVSIGAWAAAYVDTRRAGYSIGRVLVSVAIALALIGGIHIAFASPQHRLDRLLRIVTMLPWTTAAALIGAGFAKRRRQQFEEFR
jgi:protein-S-isoprenylcysteine O-methyltransferase Ste14